ncbi:hypothetical protein Taro_034378, partial [Colocasia esculenta]|nr:hypothetical protein [Colocasia esculenta]
MEELGHGGLAAGCCLARWCSGAAKAGRVCYAYGWGGQSPGDWRRCWFCARRTRGLSRHGDLEVCWPDLGGKGNGSSWRGDPGGSCAMARRCRSGSCRGSQCAYKKTPRSSSLGVLRGGLSSSKFLRILSLHFPVFSVLPDFAGDGRLSKGGRRVGELGELDLYVLPFRVLSLWGGRIRNIFSFFLNIHWLRMGVFITSLIFSRLFFYTRLMTLKSPGDSPSNQLVTHPMGSSEIKCTAGLELDKLTFGNADAKKSQKG